MASTKDYLDYVLEQLRTEERTILLYEAPHRLMRTLTELHDALGDRELAICRELTKLHEETLRMTIAEAQAYYRENEPRGEYVLVVEGMSTEAEQLTLEEALAQVKKLIDMGEKPTDACKAVAKETGFKKGELYSALQ